MTWEKAVAWLREQPGEQDLVAACFYDDPLLDAAKRFHNCAEWRAVKEFLPSEPGKALDMGAGRGIASYALAMDGWQTVALEPDPSNLVGAGAIRSISRETGLEITVVEEWGEKLPFGEATFDAVHARQVLHHSRDLYSLCAEIARVLKPAGVLVATREHVIDRAEDLQVFLDAHPLHRLYGGENAFTLEQYLGAISNAGLAIRQVLNPWASDINLFPATEKDIKKAISAKYHFPFPGLIPAFVLRWMGNHVGNPGRLYSFVGVKEK